jgi:hypothetical protein
MAPAVQLTDPNIIWQGALNGSVENEYFDVTLPFNITLYITASNRVTVGTNGVSRLI